MRSRLQWLLVCCLQFGPQRVVLWVLATDHEYDHAVLSGSGLVFYLASELAMTPSRILSVLLTAES